MRRSSSYGRNGLLGLDDDTWKPRGSKASDYGFIGGLVPDLLLAKRYLSVDGKYHDAAGAVGKPELREMVLVGQSI